MNSDSIRNAFSKRQIIKIPSSIHEFNDMACCLPRLQDIDQLNLLPSLMIAILDNPNLDGISNNCDMLVYRLMPQEKGWSNLIDEMNIDEIEITYKWLEYVRNYQFSNYCLNEFNQAIDFFKLRRMR
jgi:hypothetical protein